MVIKVQVPTCQFFRPVRIVAQRPTAAGDDDVRLGDELVEPHRTRAAGVPGEVGKVIRILGGPGDGGAAERDDPVLDETQVLLLNQAEHQASGIGNGGEYYRLACHAPPASPEPQRRTGIRRVRARGKYRLSGR